MSEVKERKIEVNWSDRQADHVYEHWELVEITANPTGTVSNGSNLFSWLRKEPEWKPNPREIWMHRGTGDREWAERQAAHYQISIPEEPRS